MIKCGGTYNKVSACGDNILVLGTVWLPYLLAWGVIHIDIYYPRGVQFLLFCLSVITLKIIPSLHWKYKVLFIYIL